MQHLRVQRIRCLVIAATILHQACVASRSLRHRRLTPNQPQLQQKPQQPTKCRPPTGKHTGGHSHELVTEAGISRAFLEPAKIASATAVRAPAAAQAHRRRLFAPPPSPAKGRAKVAPADDDLAEGGRGDGKHRAWYRSRGRIYV